MHLIAEWLCVYVCEGEASGIFHKFDNEFDFYFL